MKKILLAAAVAGALGSFGGAYAQSNVTLYGLLDLTLRTVDHANAAGDRNYLIGTPWFSGSRWGVQGSEDLGGGTKAIFKLESEYVVGTGAMDTPGILFGRDAWVGFNDNKFGKLTLGRQNTLARDFAQIYGDAYGSDKLSTAEGGFTNTNNFKHLVFYSGSDSGTRMDNGIVWKKVFDNGLVGGLGYKLGEVPGDTAKNTTKSAALGYNGSNFVVAGFYTNGNVKGLIHQSYSLGGSYFFPGVRVNGGWFHYTAEQGAGGALAKRKDNAYTVSAKFTPAGAFDYELGYVLFKADNAAYNGAGSATLNPFADTTAATTVGSGKRTALFGSAFYHLSKRTELYVAADYTKVKDGFKYAATNGADSQTELAVGIRTRF